VKSFYIVIIYTRILLSLLPSSVKITASPMVRHVPRGLADKVFMEQRIASFFERVL
jgi:hypothetical protein